MSRQSASIRTINDFAAFEIRTWGDGESCIGSVRYDFDGTVIYEYLSINRSTGVHTHHRGPTGDPSKDPEV